MSYPSYIKTAEQREAVDTLRSVLSPGQTVHTILRSVSRSGMSRRISAVVIDSDGNVRDLTQTISRTGLFGRPLTWEDPEGLKIGGAGMDMGFHLVYSISRMIFNEGAPCTGSTGYTPTGKRSKTPRCNSNDHVNDASLPYRKSITHRDGGYALRHAWL